MMKFGGLSGAGLTLMAAAMPEAAYAQKNWQDYTDTDAGYSLCYPVDMLETQPQTDNNDWRSFKGRNGAEMRISISAYPLNKTLEEAMNQTSMWVSDPNPRAYPRINYRKLYSNFYIATGNSRSENSFEKTYWKDGKFLSLDLRYPQKDAKMWAPVVKRISACFKIIQ